MKSNEHKDVDPHKSRGETSWLIRSANHEERSRAVHLGKELAVHPIIPHLLSQRGVSSVEEMRQFLQASLSELPDPILLKDIDLAARRLLDAINHGEKIVIYGDYDVDGVTSSALIWRFFKETFDAELSVYIPQRLKEGYGLNKEAVSHLAQHGAQLIVTVDNGSSAIDEVAHAQHLGIDVIIIDHHVVSDPEPPAFAHLNPHRKECTYPDKRLAAVGVAFMLLIHLRRLIRDDSRFPRARSSNLSELLDIVAVGTVADVAQLKGVNRALVKAGINTARSQNRAGLIALSEVSQCLLAELTARDIGYKLGPRLNAAGRIDDARCGFRLLISDHPHDTRNLAAHVEQYNQERRQIQEEIQREAMAQAEHFAEDAVIVVADPSWHHGVVGIVASRIVERFHRPTIVLGGDDSRGGIKLKGSARSLPHLNLKAALDLCSEHLLTYGGHAAAAGMSLEQSALEDFRVALNQAVAQASPELTRLPPLIADVELGLHEVNAQLLEQLNLLEPLGHGNPPPLLLTRGVKARVSTMSQGKHLKLHFDFPAHLPSEAIAWGMGDKADLCKGPVDICYQAKWDSFRGIRKIVLMIKGLRAHDPNESLELAPSEQVAIEPRETPSR